MTCLSAYIERQISKCTDKTLKKHYWGGGEGNCPPATLMAGNAKEADIWFGRESAREARGKFKDLVCLVVFLCWIKRFCITFIVFKMQIYEYIFFQAFKNRGGGGTIPPEKFEGGHVPPPPPRPSWDRRLCMIPLFWCEVTGFSTVIVMNVCQHMPFYHDCVC